jgi:WD40 repeat protein
MAILLVPYLVDFKAILPVAGTPGKTGVKYLYGMERGNFAGIPYLCPESGLMMPLTLPPPRGGSSTAILRVFGSKPFHTDGELLALAFAGDGSLWSVEDPGVLRRWDVTARRQTAWHALGEPATLWAFGPGARFAAAGSDDLSLWDVPTGERIATWASPSWVTAIAFRGSGELLATGHDDATVRLWDITHGEVVRVLEGHSLSVSSLAFSPDGSVLASAGEDREIHLWDVVTGTLIGSLIGHTDRISALAWHPDGLRLVSAGWDATARVWDVENLEPVILLNSHAGQLQTLAFSPDGARLACADSDCTVRIWDFALHRTLAVLPARSSELRCLAFSPDGRQLASGGLEHTVHLWNSSEQDSPPEPVDPMASRTGVAVSPDGVRIASLGAGTALRVWQSVNGQPALDLADSTPLRAFSASPDGRWYAGSRDVGDGPDQWNARASHNTNEPRSTVCLWDALSGKRLATLEGQRAPVTTLAFSSDSHILATGGYLSSDVWLWHVPSGEPALLLPGVSEGCSVETLAFQPRGQLLAIGAIDWMMTGGTDGRVFLWDLIKREVVLTLPCGATGLAFHPNGQRLAVSTLTHSVHIYDVATGELEAELIGHLGAVTCVAYSPGGRWIASGSDDRTVRLWDPETGLEQGIGEFDTQVKALTFTPDGRRLVSGNASTSCFLLDLGQFLRQ